LRKIVNEKEKFFMITDVDQKPIFFTNTINSFLHLLFVGRNSALRTGGKGPEYAIFSYFAEDKIIGFLNISDSKTFYRIEKAQKTQISNRCSNLAFNKSLIGKNILKNTFGNKILFKLENLILSPRFSTSGVRVNSLLIFKKSINN
jgi:hypothetical protein